jgi:2-haloacid dehalogenase
VTASHASSHTSSNAASASAQTTAETTSAAVDAVVFDVGGVLLDWNPRHLYRTLLADDDAVEEFLTRVCTAEWNAAQDAGRSWAEGVAELTGRFPEHAELIRAYDERWAEMVSGTLEETVAILQRLRAEGVPTYALTNFSAEKWTVALERWPFLAELDGAVVSGVERVSKPDPAIYQLLLDRHRLSPNATFYTDDLPVNVDAARAVGIRAEVFVDGATLRSQLASAGLPV